MSTQAPNAKEKYEGFIIDLLNDLSAMVDFRYDIVLVPDNNYGAKNDSSGEWNGMVREVMEGVSCYLLM